MFEERDDKGGLMHRRRFCASGDADNGLSEDRGDNGRKGGGGCGLLGPLSPATGQPGRRRCCVLLRQRCVQGHAGRAGLANASFFFLFFFRGR